MWIIRQPVQNNTSYPNRYKKNVSDLNVPFEDYWHFFTVCTLLPLPHLSLIVVN